MQKTKLKIDNGQQIYTISKCKKR